jgi:anti-anti-sigma factor
MERHILELKTPWPLVNVEEEDGDLVVRFKAESFLWPSVDEVGNTLLELADETEDCRFVLDFSNIDYLTGVGLEKLVHLHKKLQSNGRRLIIKNVDPLVLKIFSLTGLIKEFDVRSPNPFNRNARRRAWHE